MNAIGNAVPWMRVVSLCGTCIFLATFLVYPLIGVLGRAFTADGAVSVRHFTLLFRSPSSLDLILNSFNIAIAVTCLVTAIALPLSLIFSRTRFSGQRVASLLLIVPLFLPPFVGALGLRQILGRFGSLNLLLMHMNVIDHPVDWLGSQRAAGVVIMQALHLYPLMFLALNATLASLNPALEEAGHMSGASRGKVLRRIVFPLLMPGYIGSAVLVFIASFTDLGTPLLFEYRRVVPVYLYNMLNELDENRLVYALVVLVAVLSAILFLIARRATAHGSFETSSRGRVTRPRKQLSRARRTLVHLLITFILCISLLPHLGVLLISCADSWFMTVLPDRYTAEHYVAVFQHPLTVVSLRNSIMLALLSTGLDIVLGFTVAFLVLRTSIPGRSVLDAFSVMPLAIPGIIIALGYISAFSGTFLDNRINPFPLLVAAYAVRRLPYMVRSCVAGFQQGSIVLEEAARSVGAPPALVFRRVTLPLMSAHVMSGAILCFAFAMLEVSDSLFLALEERYYPVSKALYALSGRPDGVAIAAALGVVVTSLITACIYAAGKLSGRSIDEVFRA